ncbi:tobamovirus multiplication protein 1-like isoform X2 [Quercus robur]|uniref:tobamovirus multiplication protein 1-like isoform X2 n=1 Tax=Quercus robur TaxID=38942 RepID=UPI00216274EE|nr:tobamovirus multiplication protein 1-like isoform X2 [Quercus robur]
MAWTPLRTKSFVVKDGEIIDNGGGVGLLFNWWDEIEESEQWQRGIYYALCVSYALVSFITLVQLLRIQLRVPEYGWTTQKVFHLMNFIVNGLRSVLFGLYKSVFLIRPKARSLPTNKLRPAYYVINGLIYIIQVCIWIFIRLSRSPVAVETAKLFFSVISFSVALGFLIYGGRLFVMLRHFPIESRGRQKKLYEVGFVTGICCTCFLIRCVMLAFSAFDKDTDFDILDHPILNLIYYLLVEIVPSALVLFILRKLPPRRVSDQYYPIR